METSVKLHAVYHEVLCCNI